MELTNEIVEKYGYARINNSMWRKGNFTLQNGHTNEGSTLLEKILNTQKAYKVCFKGKFVRMITTEDEIKHICLNTNKRRCANMPSEETCEYCIKRETRA